MFAVSNCPQMLNEKNVSDANMLNTSGTIEIQPVRSYNIIDDFL